MTVPSQMSLRRIPEALHLQVRVAYAAAWEALIATHTTEALLRRARAAGPHIGAMCAEIYRLDGAISVRRILGVLSLAKKHGVPVVDDAARAALDLGAPNYRFLRRYLERRPAAPLTLKQVDPLIRQLSLYRDLIQRRTEE